MSDPDTDSPTESLEKRVERLEQRAATPGVSHILARFYGPLAVVALATSFTPYYENVTIEHDSGGEMHYMYGTVWEMAARGASAFLGVLLLLALVAVLVVATVPLTNSPLLPVGIAVCAGLLGLMLLLRPGTGTVTPGLTDTGIAAVALLFCCIATAVTQLILQRTRESRG